MLPDSRNWLNEGIGMENRKKESIWTKGFILLFVINFCYQMGQQMMNTLVPKYANTFGVSAVLVGLISSVFAIASLAGRPFTSPALDTFSKKKMLMGTILLASAVFWGYGATSNIYTLIGFRLVHGICIGIFSPLAMMMASNVLPDEKLGSGIGVFALGQAIGQAVGPGIGLSLSNTYGYSIAFHIGAVVMLIPFALCFLIPKEKKSEKKYKISVGQILEKDALSPGIITMLLAISYSCIGSYLAIYGEARGVENIGLYFTVYAVFLLATRPLSGMLADKYGIIALMIPGIVCAGISFLMLSVAKGMPAFLITAGVAACGYGICQPQAQALTLQCVKKERRGVGSNTNFFFMDCGTLIGPVLAGSVIDFASKATATDAGSYAIMYRVMLIPMGAALLYLFFKKKKIQETIDKNKGE